MKIVHYFANGCFDWLISGQQSDNPLREAMSIMSGEYKRFTFVHIVIYSTKCSRVCKKYAVRYYVPISRVNRALDRLMRALL